VFARNGRAPRSFVFQPKMLRSGNSLSQGFSPMNWGSPCCFIFFSKVFSEVAFFPLLFFVLAV